RRLNNDSDVYVRQRAAALASAIGDPSQVLEPLHARMNNDVNVYVQRTCAQAITELGPRSGEAVHVMGKALQDHPDAAVRGIVATGLAAIGSRAMTETASVVQGLKERSLDIVLPSVVTAGNIGRSMQDVTPRLLEIAVSQPDNPNVQLQVARAL